MGKSEYKCQTTLFDLTTRNTTEAMPKGASVFQDPAFASNKTSPIHRWVPWIAGFSKEFVQSALNRHLGERGIVLDPFAGVGTTLVEAALAGHNTTGFEINPYAALACRVKLEAYQLRPKIVSDSTKEFLDFYEQVTKKGYKPRCEPPAGFKTRSEFYSPMVMHKVLAVQDYIAKIKDRLLRDIFKIAFASTMVTYSNYSYEPSLSRREAAGKKPIEDFPVGETVACKLFEMAQDIEWMRDQLDGKKLKVNVFNKSFFSFKESLSAKSVDLIITSPPYLNNYHYNRNTRPHLYWLGFAKEPSDFKMLEEENFGKYWQTVRDRKPIELCFEMRDGEVADCLRIIRGKKPEKGVYGGNGWANYAASYFNDCYRFVKAIKYLLKRKGTALIVLGNSILQGVMVPTDKFFGKIAESVGLELVDIHIPRNARVGNSIIQSDVRVERAKDSHHLYEAVVELRKR